MSLFGALNTAVSGLSAQSAAFGNIADNIANSQTVGFKEVNTAFSDLLTTSTAAVNDPGGVTTLPQYMNNVQGTIVQSVDPLALAISGQGFFPVSQSVAGDDGQITFSPTPSYTRAGDFQMNQSGYLVNSAGDYLNGWTVDPTSGVVNTSAIAPIQVNQTAFNPVATSTMTLAANLPATPASGTPVSSQVDVYDSLGTSHEITLNWTPIAGTPNTWNLQIVSPDDQNPAPAAAVTDASGNPVLGTIQVSFGANGTISGLSAPVSDYGTIGAVSAGAAGTPATFSFSTQFVAGTSQPITLNLGNYGEANGVTQYAGTTYNLEGISQNGVPPGSFSGVSTTSAGAIVVNYDNGQNRTIAQVPVVTFNAPNQLQNQDGQSFTATQASGNPLINAAGSNGAGSLVTGSVESSNVDIGTEFTNLIVAQQAYSANTKVVTTDNQMLQDAINMIQ
jgi:flagellar hook protein FlgE